MGPEGSSDWDRITDMREYTHFGRELVEKCGRERRMGGGKAEQYFGSLTRRVVFRPVTAAGDGVQGDVV